MTAGTFSQVDFEVLGDLTFDDIKEMGVSALGPRRKIFKEITTWREEREVGDHDLLSISATFTYHGGHFSQVKKNDAIRAKMAAGPAPPADDEQTRKLRELRASLGGP